MSAKSRGFSLLRKSSFAVLVGLIAVAASAASTAAQVADPGPGQRGHKRALLANFAGGMVTAHAQYGANLIASTFETALKRSRDTARSTSKPIPEDVRAALMPFYSVAQLEGVRYSIGDFSPTGLAGFAIRNGKAAAVTLIDTIVFKDEGYVQNVALWSHEVHHVQQYKEWGVTGFAQRYLFGWQAVEDAADARAKEFIFWRRARHGRN